MSQVLSPAEWEWTWTTVLLLLLTFYSIPGIMELLHRFQITFTFCIPFGWVDQTVTKIVLQTLNCWLSFDSSVSVFVAEQTWCVVPWLVFLFVLLMTVVDVMFVSMVSSYLCNIVCLPLRQVHPKDEESMISTYYNLIFVKNTANVLFFVFSLSLPAGVTFCPTTDSSDNLAVDLFI